LRVLARVMRSTTHELLARVGIEETARCLDVGCGGGDVTAELARMAPAGSVTGIDLDETKLDIARAEAAEAGLDNIAFRVADVMEPIDDPDGYDLIYVRFVFTHLTDPSGAATNLVAALAPGGTLVVEDIDFTGHFCYPDSPAFWRYVEWYSRAVQGRGADPNIGPRLPSLLTDAGLHDVQIHVAQPAGMAGEVKLISPITLEAIADAVLSAGLATPEQLEQTVDELYAFATTHGTLLSVPRIVQTWARHS
jgi:SAM-dependent methyltransferase